MGRSLALTLALTWMPGPASANAQPPGAERARALVEALAAGDAGDLVAFFREHMAAERFARRSEEEWKRTAGVLMHDLGGLEVSAIRPAGPDRIEIVGERGGEVLTVALSLDPANENRVLGIGLDMGGHADPDLAAPALTASMTDAEAAAALAAWFASLAEEQDFSGTALVARRGEPIFEGAWGAASRRFGIPNTVQTRFDLGSINKSFTRIAIGKLAGEGVLSLDSTIAEVLPGYPNAEVAARVTVQQLLDHTSGLPDIFGPEFFESSKLLYQGPRDFFPLFVDRELDFEPGSSRKYSNGGYMVLGAMIEALTGQPYREWVAEHVFGPAGMAAAGFPAWNEPVPDVAVGHTRWGPEGPDPEAPWKENVGLLPIRGNSAGSAFATVQDLLAFDRALRSGKLLPPGWTSWFFGGPIDPTADRPEADRATLGIAGGAPGVSASLESSAELQVIVLSNQDEPAAEAAAGAIFRALSEP